ncbi:MAG: TonB-dependent receptor [Spongiibacteraceae bacterium]
MKNVMHQQPDQTLVKLIPCSRKMLAVSIALLAASAPAFSAAENAKGAFDEVVVTAQRRTELAIDVPISITAIDSDQLSSSNAQQLADLSKLTPSLRFDRAGSQSQPTIRGVGTSVAVAGGSSNVGIYTDGFYSPNPLAADFDLLNISSIQVLKGPQGTLFGRNSTGGAILVTTKEPSTLPSADISASYGSYNTQRYQVYATGGLFDNLAVDIAGQLRKSDGFVDNTVTGSDDDAAYENSSVRIGAKLDVTDKISALLRYSYADNEDNTFLAVNAYEDNGRVFATAGALAETKPHKVSNNLNPAFTGRSSATQLTVKADLDFALLTSFTQYRDERGRSIMDFDMSPLSLFHYKYDNVDTIFTQEFLLASTGEDRLQWTTGLFYFNNKAIYENNQSSSPFINSGRFTRDGGSGVEVNTLAAYGDLTYEILNNLYLTAGLRYSKDKIENGYFKNPPSAGDENLITTDAPNIDDDEITPRLVLRYKISESSSTYASYTEGYKSGILNVGGGTLDGIEVKPEKIKAYEIGYKFSSGPIMFDTSAYYYDYKDLQVASYIGASSIIKNAATSNIYGVDGQVRYVFADNWETNLGIAYVHTEYDKFDESQTWDQLPNGIFWPNYSDASGNEMQRAPELTATLGLTYRTDLAAGKLAISGNVYHTSDFYFDSSNLYKQDAYDLLSARAEWTDPSGHYSIAVFGDNLTDEEYRNQVLPQYYGALSTWGAPRTFGVSAGLHF